MKMASRACTRSAGTSQCSLGRVGPHIVRASSKDVPREGKDNNLVLPEQEASPPGPAFPITECYCWPYAAVTRAEEKEVLLRHTQAAAVPQGQQSFP